ncbi:MAG: helix-turn-helix transcriptional regulator [Phycisphaerales bacterium]|nr:helix-turn-helix transcriptional regulator [Phycisphaerales bacterium]
MTNNGPGPTLSMALVDYLREQGRTLHDIGDMIGLSESFISRVANGHRGFTIDHLEAFERNLGQPLAALLVEARWRNSIPEEMRGKYEEVLTLLRDLAGLRTQLDADEVSDSDEVGETRTATHGPAPVRPGRSPGARRAVG